MSQIVQSAVNLGKPARGIPSRLPRGNRCCGVSVEYLRYLIVTAEPDTFGGEHTVRGLPLRNWFAQSLRIASARLLSGTARPVPYLVLLFPTVTALCAKSIWFHVRSRSSFDRRPVFSATVTAGSRDRERLAAHASSNRSSSSADNERPISSGSTVIRTSSLSFVHSL